MPLMAPGPVGHVDADDVEVARDALEGGLERAPAGACRLADEARQVAGVALLERVDDVVQAAAVLVGRGQQGLAVVEEDVDPDARVRAGHARHVAERAAGGRQRVVAVDGAGPGLRGEQVRDNVRQVARQRHEPVVGARVDRDRPRADGRHHAVDLGEALRVGVVHRRQEVRGALEQLGPRGRGAARLGAADGMPADEAPTVGALHATDDVRLRGADVGHGGRGRRRGDGRGDRGRQLRHRRADDDEIGALAGAREVAVGSLHAAPLEGDCARRGIGVVAAHGGTRPARQCQAERSTHQPETDDRDTHRPMMPAWQQPSAGVPGRVSALSGRPGSPAATRSPPASPPARPAPRACAGRRSS